MLHSIDNFQLFVSAYNCPCGCRCADVDLRLMRISKEVSGVNMVTEWWAAMAKPTKTI